MKKIIIICVAMFALNTSSFAGRCSGGKNCTACKNCSACKHCSQQGGTCSVCAPEEKPKAKAKPKTKAQKPKVKKEN
jgi:hypothetical protein